MIEFSHVSKLFGAQKAVNDLNLNFQEGSFSVLIGTSGSGKSTTLKMINRLVEHDSGVIRFAGEEIRSLPVLELRRRMGYAIQSIGLFPHWSVAQNIATVPQLQKWSRARIDDRIDELMALLGLESNLRERYPHQLSGGQQQRVGVARALAEEMTLRDALSLFVARGCEVLPVVNTQGQPCGTLHFQDLLEEA
ncbi:TPA: ATP-binding cassette domain-containing protein [Escherichia coli]|nr:ATP-binding cassette domain-containing protein [Escherichia coli]